jgi:hypothetical protein
MLSVQGEGAAAGPLSGEELDLAMLLLHFMRVLFFNSHEVNSHEFNLHEVNSQEVNHRKLTYMKSSHMRSIQTRLMHKKSIYVMSTQKR